MRMKIVLAVAGSLALAACSSTPGPVQPEVGPKAPGVLVEDPTLRQWLDVPDGQQTYTHSKLGFLEYNVVVRNRGTRDMTLAYSYYCFDDAGRQVEFVPLAGRIFVKQNSEYPIQVTANSREARTMRIQIRPAD